MKKIMMLAAAISAGAGLHAQVQDVKSSYSVTTDFAYTSEYVFRGLKNTGSSFQPSVEASVKDFYLGLWTNQPITRHESNEIDVYAGYKYNVTTDLSLEAVGSYYWYPEAKTGETKDTYEGGVGATYTYKGLTTSAYYYYDFILHANTLQGSVAYSFPLEAIGASIDVTGFAGTVQANDWLPASGVGVEESYNYYGADVSIPYKLSEKATFTVGGHWSINQGAPEGTEVHHLWFTTGVTVGF